MNNKSRLENAINSFFPKGNRLKKSDGSSYFSPMEMPMTAHGLPDWETPKEKSFVILPINNKKSSLNGRFVILEKLPNGLYRIAENPEHKKHKNKKTDQPDDPPEDRDADIDDLDKGPHRYPRSQSRRSWRKVGQRLRNIGEEKDAQ